MMLSEVQVKEQRYRVFIAHDVSELGAIAVEASFELVKHQCIPMGIGLNPSSQNNHWDVIRAMIDESDVVFLLVGDSYGQLSPSGVSYVHMAYIYATTQGKPIFPFCLKRSEVSGMVNAHLGEFRKLLSSHKVRYWTVEADLRKQLLMAIRKIKTAQKIGLLPVSAKPSVTVSAGVKNHLSQSSQMKEIKALKQELEEAKKALAINSTALVRGPSKNKTVMVSFSAKVFSGGNFKTISETWSMTWDSIFLAVAPHMLKPISEEKMRLVISAVLATDVQAPIKEKYPESHAVADIRLTNDSINRIKIYLRGQDLIREVMQGRDIRWKLTESGDAYLTELYTEQPISNSFSS
ncbi:DUF4062 domain-containing protein [Litoribrevibacter albus]|uniref:DUF4062 domain-containing protein n=1 Tax=Litoribrevibacter albus TaxID=1473156 RepID=A0AA37SC66_9GAMM|nr:DUF4062 domain-containing protein [Litoribrevibacter albus]GLQ32063.1 hypothetical protein GCM10007876_25420 [Litoribrevibacter albus]